MKREDLVRQTQDLIDQGDRISRAPSRAALNTWLAASDALLSSAWGQMDRYHQAWLDVGRIAQPLRGRQISEGEEADEVRAVALILAMSFLVRDMPFQLINVGALTPLHLCLNQTYGSHIRSP